MTPIIKAIIFTTTCEVFRLEMGSFLLLKHQYKFKHKKTLVLMMWKHICSLNLYKHCLFSCSSYFKCRGDCCFRLGNVFRCTCQASSSLWCQQTTLSQEPGNNIINLPLIFINHFNVISSLSAADFHIQEKWQPEKYISVTKVTFHFYFFALTSLGIRMELNSSLQKQC